MRTLTIDEVKFVSGGYYYIDDKKQPEEGRNPSDCPAEREKGPAENVGDCLDNPFTCAGKAIDTVKDYVKEGLEEAKEKEKNGEKVDPTMMETVLKFGTGF